MLLSLPSGNLCHLHQKCCMASTGQHFTPMKLKSTFFGPFVSGTVAKWLKWVHSLGVYRLSALSLPVWGLPNRSSCHRFEIEAAVHHVGDHLGPASARINTQILERPMTAIAVGSWPTIHDFNPRHWHKFFQMIQQIMAKITACTSTPYDSFVV